MPNKALWGRIDQRTELLAAIWEFPPHSWIFSSVLGERAEEEDALFVLEIFIAQILTCFCFSAIRKKGEKTGYEQVGWQKTICSRVCPDSAGCP